MRMVIENIHKKLDSIRSALGQRSNAKESVIVSREFSVCSSDKFELGKVLKKKLIHAI